MAPVRNVAVLVGSLRKGSFNRLIATALAELASPGLALSLVEIGNLPFYNEDTEADGAPATWTAFRQTIAAADAVLFVTPEYNRSVSAVLKNALDVGSRPVGQNVWNGKPGAVISVSRGQLGGFGANNHLRQSLVAVNVPAMAQPEAYVANVDGLLDAEGNLADPETRTFLTGFAAAFAAWIETVKPAPSL